MQQTFLPFQTPPTQSIKYIGSKLKLIPHILQLVKKVNAKTVLDGFTGTTRVSQALAKLGYSVLCNDIAPWSKILGTCYLLNTKSREAYQPLIDHLNAVPPVDGWFTEHYGGHANGGCAVQTDGLKKPWQLHNTRKLDAIRQEIETLNLDPENKAVALTSLILALDRVDSTLGHFSAYLKDWAPRAYKELVLEVPEVFTSKGDHEVHQTDIFELVPRVSVDLAYFDPPYGQTTRRCPPLVSDMPPTTTSGKALCSSTNLRFSAKQNDEKIHQIFSPPLYLRNFGTTTTDALSPLQPSRT